MKKITLLSLALFVLFVNSILAQDNQNIKEFANKIIAPSPTVYEFSRFGNLPINGSTGAFNYNLPIYTAQSGDISLPIAIGYYSSGVQIDGLSGIVGTDWNLSAGGVISRIVKDYPDELAGFDGRLYFPPNEIFSVLVHANDIKNIARDLNYSSSYDGEQDSFSFNVNGISGSFYFDKDLVPHVSSEQSLKITFEIGDGNSKFTIIDENGYKYIFGGSDAAVEKTLNYNQCDTVENLSYITGWFLTEIISPKNNSITFSYDPNEFYYSNNLSVSSSAQDTCGYEIVNDNNQIVLKQIPLLTNPDYNVCLNSNSVWSRVLSTIHFQNTSVVFNYNTQRLDGGGKSLKEIKVLNNTELIKQIEFNYDMVQAKSTPLNSVISTVNETGVNYRMFLKDITFKGNLSSNNYEKYSFDYYNKNELPARLTYSKDKFGYNNGSVNTSPFSNKTLNMISINNLTVPFPTETTANKDVNPNMVYYGMLNKITYPTGGYTNILYEANKDIKTSELPIPIERNIGVIKYCDTNTTPVTGSFEFVSNGLPINFDAFANIQGGNCTTGSSFNKYKLTIYKDNQIILETYQSYGLHITSDTGITCLSSFTSVYNAAPVCTVAGSTYKITLTLEKGGVYGNVIVKYNGDYSEETVYGAGARVQEITDYTNEVSFNKRKIYYNKLTDYLSNNTTMQHFFEPQYNKMSNIVIWCPIYVQTRLPWCTDYTPSLVYRYSISSDPINSGYLSRQPINYSAITEVLENNNIKNGAIEKIFAPSADSPARLYNGTDIYGNTPDNYGELLKDKIIEETIYDNLNHIKSNNKFEYALFDNNYLTAFKAIKNYIFPLDELGFPGAYTDVCVDPYIWFPQVYNYSVWGYKNYYGIVKLLKTTNKNYYQNQNIETITTNTFSNAPFYSLTTTTNTNSKGENLKTEFKYPSDLIGVEQTPYMQQLVDAHRIAEPVITKTFNGSVKLSEKHTKFENSSATANLLLPSEIHTRKGTTDINITAVEDRKIQFVKYDAKGNIQLYTLENGVSVTILWGYNNQYPVAKIENATIAQVQALINQSILDSPTDENSLRTELQKIRTGLPNAMVTTYTYAPLIGMTSMTDPKGDTTYYNYDSFGRLQNVKDKDGNILSENQYHYKN